MMFAVWHHNADVFNTMLDEFDEDFLLTVCMMKRNEFCYVLNPNLRLSCSSGGP